MSRRAGGIVASMDTKEEGLITGDIGKHWYYRAKLNALLRITQDLQAASVLDVGAGLGFFSRALLMRTSVAKAVCIDPAYATDHCEMLAGKSLCFRRQIDRSDAGLVLMMDVIKHVKDDVGLVAEYVAKVGPGPPSS
jgi:2-polyprenyl-3-methyl-5-hydroxy-6-metoxy-1,4-benzoquinol methylase